MIILDDWWFETLPESDIQKPKSLDERQRAGVGMLTSDSKGKAVSHPSGITLINF